MFKELLKKENPVIFEIGANDGTDTVNFFKEFKNPTLHCFEPDPDTFKRFLEKQNLFLKIFIVYARLYLIKRER